jgi:hypothetical protein
MAHSGVLDPRPLVLIYFADCDPSGHQMILSVTRKLQGFAHLPDYKALQFMPYRALLTPDQVRTYDLPESLLSPKEKRADTWTEAYGVEQTEVARATSDSVPRDRGRLPPFRTRHLWVRRGIDVGYIARATSDRRVWWGPQ